MLQQGLPDFLKSGRASLVLATASPSVGHSAQKLPTTPFSVMFDRIKALVDEESIPEDSGFGSTASIVVMNLRDGDILQAKPT